MPAVTMYEYINLTIDMCNSKFWYVLEQLGVRPGLQASLSILP